MNKARLSAIQFKYILLVFVFVFNTAFSSLVAFIPAPVSAESFSGELDGIREPALSSNEEVGIWADRSLIYLYFNSKAGITDEGAETPSSAFYPEVTGLNDGNIDYSNQDGCKLKVNFASNDDTPSSGTMSSCPGVATNVRLVNQKNAYLDGYFYKDGGEDNVVFMPRYIKGIDGCGTTDSGVLKGVYGNDGYFTKSGSQYTLERPESTGNTKVNSVDTSDSRLVTAKQHRTSGCRGSHFGDKTLSYAGDGADGGRKIWFLKNFSRDEVKTAVKNKINEFISRKGRQSRLAEYFDTSSAGRAALDKCKRGAEISGSQDDLIALLVDVGNNQGSNPFVDCMLRELNGDAEFQTAMDYQYDGNFEEDLQQDSGDNCSSSIGIPLVGDIVCYLVRLVFDAINSAFTTVINYFGNTADTFGRFSSDKDIKTIWSGLRNLASVLFVIAFLVVVFQYLTNINVVDAYFVKKFIPRLAIAIILVQASLWIVTEMNYITTDLGKSIQSLLFYSASGGSTVRIDTAGSFIASNFGAFIIFGVAAAPIALCIGIVLLLVLVLTIIILVIRELLLVVLAVLAPLAFATIAIPQLESTMKKWLTSYVKLLAMYPIMMLFISVGAIVGNMLNQLGGFYALMGFIAYFLPFLILPFSFKLAGGIGGSIGAKLASAGNPKNLAKKGYGAYKKGENMYETKTDRGRARAADKKNAEAIKGQRAHEAGSQRTLDRMRNASGPGLRNQLARRRLYGNGSLEESEMMKSQSILEAQEKKRKTEEAESVLQRKLAATTNRNEAVDVLERHYESAMHSGDEHAAAAAYSQLVGRKETGSLAKIQEDAYAGTYGTAGVAAYNKQQGDNYGALGEFSPHLRGEVDSTKTVAQHRMDNLSKLSDDQLSTVNADTWKEWQAHDPGGAANRVVSIVSKGGGAASKITAEVKQVMASDPANAARMNRSDAQIEAAHPLVLANRDELVQAAKAERDKWKSALS